MKLKGSLQTLRKSKAALQQTMMNSKQVVKKTRTGRIQEEVDNPPFVILATPDTMEKS
jgi:hypothetical protein